MNRTTSNGARTLAVEILTVAWMKTNLMAGYPFIGPGFDAAISHSTAVYSGLNFTLHAIPIEGSFQTCQEWAMESDNRVAEFYYRNQDRQSSIPVNLTIVIIPGCAGLDVAGIAQFATGLRKVAISTGASVPFIYDKTNFPSVLTTNYVSSLVYTSMYRNLFDLFNWTSVMILTDTTSNPGYAITTRHLMAALSRENGNHLSLEAAALNFSSDVSSMLQRLRNVSRIIVLSGDALPVRNLLLQAHQHNLTEGSFVFIVHFPVPLFGKPSLAAPQYSFPEERNAAILQAFRVCLFLNLDPSVTTVEASLGNSFKTLSRTKYNYTYGPQEQVSATVLYSYAATVIAGQVVHEINERSPDWDWNDGPRLARKFFSRTFNTRVGNVTLSRFGERLTTMTFSCYNHEKGEFFTIFQQGSGNEQLQLLAEPKSWPGLWPIQNEPRCGFRGDRVTCLLDDGRFSPVLYSCSAVAVALLLFVGLLIGRRLLHRSWHGLNFWIIQPVDFRQSIPKELVPIVTRSIYDRLYSYTEFEGV